MEKNKIIGQLREIKSIAAESTLTGMLGTSTKVLINHYNVLFKLIKEEGDSDLEAMFTELDESTSMAELGAYAGLLLRYIKDSEK